MQPIESKETINHSSNLDSKNTRRQTNNWHEDLFAKVWNHHPWSLRLYWGRLSCSQGQLQAGSVLTAFLTSLALASFLSEAKRTFTNFFKTHHTLGSSRVTSSCLGGFTFKSNKCHKDRFTKIKCSSAHKEDSFNPPLRISHKSQDPHKEELERAHKGLGWVYFVGSISNLQRRVGESFHTCPKKTSR
jgi:hypothetical protein